MPASAVCWRTPGWAAFHATTGLVVAGMAPAEPSLDVRLDRWVSRNLDDDLPDIWVTEMQVPFWTGLAAGGLGTWGAARLWGWPRVAEGMSLTGEAFGVAQTYHLVLKLALGREGPTDGEGLGRVRGPVAAFALFPAGTPSGHAASLFSVLGALDAYWDPHWGIAVPAHAVVTGLIAMHVLNHRHFLSDSIWGGAMGYAIGRWTVRHRAHPRDGAPPAGWGLRPWGAPGVVGLAAAW